MTDIAKEYAAALFHLACEEGCEAEYAEGLEEVSAVFTRTPEYLTMLASPSIPLGERLNAIVAAFSGNVPEYILSYLLLLCEKGRISCYPDSAEEYRALYNASRNVVRAVVTSAVPLTSHEQEKLQAKLNAMAKGTAVIEYRQDSSLIGGLIVELDGKVMDGSLRHRLSEVKEVMTT
jgi:F-type H+-transporting ATPase subunit delta